jgi:hypothetical protein
MDHSAVTHSLKSIEPTTVQALTIIDLYTHFMEITALKNKESITIARTFDQVWLCCYPHPVDCLHDNGTEFINTKFQELLQSYGIRSKLTTVKNPQASGILKQTHQDIGNLLHSSCLITQDLATISAQQELLISVIWAINTTFCTTLKASPAQLTFNHDMILPTSFATNCYAINHCKQANHNLPLKPKTANAFCTNFASMIKSSSIVTLETHIWKKLPNVHKALSKSLTYNNYQSMVLFLSSNHRLLLSTSTFTNCCHFLNVTIEDTNVVPWSL